MRSRARELAVAVALIVLGGATAYHVARAFFSRRIASGVTNHRIVPGIATAERALVIVLDGLRRDIALDSGRLPFAQELAAEGASGPSFARDPTMTGAGVRALATGTPPAFSDIVENKRIARVPHQHLLSALVDAGHVVAAVGDHTWTDGFGDAIAIPHTVSGVPRFLDLMDPVYRQDAAFLAKARAVLRERRATVTVVHLFGTDAVSHGRGPHSAAYTRKLARLDGELRELAALCEPHCLVVLTSDHAASDRGHHGLGEPIARETPLVMRGPGIRPGARFVANQADVAPTLATLLNAAIPAPARGRVLVEAMEISDTARRALAIANAARLADYARAHDAAFDTSLPRIDVAALVAAPDPAAAVDAADRASAAILEALHADDVWRTRRLLPWIVGLVAAAALALWCFVPHRAKDRRARVIAGLALVAMVVGFVWWRTSAAGLHRELLATPWLFAIPRIAYAGFVIALGAVGALLLRQLRADDRVLALLVLVGVAAASDQLLLWAAFGALATFTGRAAPCLLVAAIPWSFAPAIALYGTAALAAIALARWQLHARVTARWQVVLVLAFAAGALVRIANAPPLPMRLLLLALGIAVLVALASSARRALVGWLATSALLAMSTAPQVLGLVAILGAVTLAPRCSAQRFAALVVAGRLAMFALLEQRFSYSRVEWQVGGLGNPDGAHPLDHALIAIKVALPMLALLGVGAGRLSGRYTEGLGWITAYLLVHMAFSIGSLVLTAGQVHTPFVDLSELLFVAAFLGSVAAAWLFEAIGRACPGDGDARP